MRRRSASPRVSNQLSAARRLGISASIRTCHSLRSAVNMPWSNCVAKSSRRRRALPGPFWTPAIATSGEATVRSFGTFTMMGRAGQPEEIAPAYVFLAADASFVTGALLEVSGGFKSVD